MLLHVAPLPADGNIVLSSVLSVGGSRRNIVIFEYMMASKVGARGRTGRRSGGDIVSCCWPDPPASVRYKMFVLLQGTVQ